MPIVRSEWLHSKTEAAAKSGMVTAEHHLAAEAGVQILQDGGNAVDAAVGAGFVMGVVEPFTSGIGGIAGLVTYLVVNGLDGLFGACVRLASGEGRGALTTVARRRASPTKRCAPRPPSGAGSSPPVRRRSTNCCPNGATTTARWPRSKSPTTGTGC